MLKGLHLRLLADAPRHDLELVGAEHLRKAIIDMDLAEKQPN